MITPSAPRIAYLDNLRILVTSLVVLHHIAITYGAPGSWYFYDQPVSELGQVLLTVFVALNSSFFMGFFFLLAGYFTPSSYDRKGPIRFLWDRLLRLGIPLAAFSFLFDPLLKAIQAVGVWNPGSPFGQAYLHHLQDLTFNPGPLWFVTALLIFGFAYALLRWGADAFGRRPRETFGRLAPQWILVFGLLLGVITFLVRIPYPSGRVWFVFQLGDFPQYVALFVAGILARRQRWLEGLTAKDGRLWRWLALGFAVALPVVGFIGGAFDGDPSEFQGGTNWQSMVGSLWWSLQGIAICVALLATFKERLNRQGWLAREAARDAYAVFIIHAPVVVGISILLMRTALAPGIKWLLVSGLATAACFLLASGIRRLPLVRRIL